jgi:lipoprotein-releasing system ATP-binding protein
VSFATKTSIEHVVEAEGVTVSYIAGGTRTHVLRSVSIALRRGRVAILMGPSGSGKTTLLSVLGGLLTPDIGSVRLGGQNLYELGHDRRAALRLRSMGFVFQSFRLLSALSSVENVALPLRLQGVPVTLARTRAQEMLATVGLSDKRNARPSDLSGGQRQRVAIARALVSQPALILADEPTANLDETNSHAVTELLANVAHEQGIAIGLVTHDIRLTAVADEILHLEEGRLRCAPV